MMRKPATALATLCLLVGLTACGDKQDDSPTTDDSQSSTPSDTTGDTADNAATTPPVFTDGPGDVTLTFSGGEEQLGAGEFDQSELTISVGQTVEFQAGDGGTYAVKVGGLDGVTISGGLKEYYRFDAAGTYSVEEDISGATATIIVQ